MAPAMPAGAGSVMAWADGGTSDTTASMAVAATASSILRMAFLLGPGSAHRTTACQVSGSGPRRLDAKLAVKVRTHAGCCVHRLFRRAARGTDQAWVNS